ncbi:MAG: hypothetical protein KL840_07555 [Aquamicrobium sp.]|nr:hypothetical protein [Aquamicrobium sp.]
MNSFDVGTTRRMSLGLLAALGAILFAALNLIAAGIAASNLAFAAQVSKAIWPLAYSSLFSLLATIFAEIAAHRSTLKRGHPHSKANYLQSAFAFIGVNGLGGLLVGTFLMIQAVTDFPSE